MSFSIRNTTEPTQILSSTLVKGSKIIADTIVSGITFSNIVATYIPGKKLYTVNLFTPNNNSWWVGNGGARVGSPLLLRDGSVFSFGFDASVILAKVNTVNMLPEPRYISIGNSAIINDIPDSIINNAYTSQLNVRQIVVANTNANLALGTSGSSIQSLAVSENDYVLLSLGTQSQNNSIVSGTISVELTYFELLPTD